MSVLQITRSSTRYFASRFPNMLMTVYVFAVENLPSDAVLRKAYWPGGVETCQPFLTAFKQTHPLAISDSSQEVLGGGVGNQRGEGGCGRVFICVRGGRE